MIAGSNDCTVEELYDAIINAVRDSLGNCDMGRAAEMSDVGDVLLTIHSRIRELHFIDEPHRRDD